MVFFSNALTVAAASQPVTKNLTAVRKVTQISLIIRSMGTATYVAVGGRGSQDRRLTTVGDSISIDAPLGSRYIDVSTLFVSSDTSDAVLEIIGDTYTGVF